MESPSSEIHQVGTSMIHLRREKMEQDGEYLGLIEGGGICIANSFPTPSESDAWLHRLFERLYPSHRCGLGCVRMPGFEFLATDNALESLAGSEPRRSA